MLAEILGTVDEGLLAAVCQDRWSESQTLEFKRVLPGTDEAAKDEFLKDICALANSSGGDIVYGISEVGGSASALSPIQITQHPVDATKRRLGQLIESGVEPRVAAVSMHAVACSAGGYVLIVRVPSSFQQPHRCRAGTAARWVVRVDTRTADLTYNQIRSAFGQGAALVDGARRFRDERVSRVLSGNSGQPIQAGPTALVHLVPLCVDNWDSERRRARPAQRELSKIHVPGLGRSE